MDSSEHCRFELWVHNNSFPHRSELELITSLLLKHCWLNFAGYQYFTPCSLGRLSLDDDWFTGLLSLQPKWHYSDSNNIKHQIQVKSQ